MLKQAICLLLGGSVLFSALPAHSEIYRYVDKNGLIHFSDKPLNEAELRPKPLPKRARKAARKPAQSTQIRIYKYTDPKGVVHMTDTPPDSRYKLIYVGKNLSFSSRDSLSPARHPPRSLRKRAALYQDMINAAARRTELEPALLHAVITAESAYNPDATSPKGAAGLMQLMPATAKNYGVSDRYDPEENILGGSSYLKDLMGRFNNNLELVLAAYNAGENAVIRYGNQIPPYRETKYYVKKVLALYEGYRS